VTQASWLDWDGRTVRWQCAASSVVELRIDGIVFERIATSDGTVERSFSYSPTGNPCIEFSLCAAGGAILLPSWRVVHDKLAKAGVSEWGGSAPCMRAIVKREAWTNDTRGPISIVIPIFNAATLVERCIDAVIRWTSSPARLILIDDASDDPAVAALLKKYTSRQNITVLRNAENLGYTRTSNLGIQASGDDDVVLLNSDTQVGPRWLDRLRQVAHSDASVGTVTAVSDNAGAFSVPEIERYCPVPTQWTLQQAQRALLQQVASPPPELPTGNGFCMFIKRAMLDAVGVLDAEAFPFGYGEENDLCQRAERVGFRHLIAGDVFVAHVRSASFGDDRRARLGEQGMAVLRQRYPDYEEKVGATLYSFARRVLDYRVRRIYADAAHAPVPRPRMLVIASDINVATRFAESRSDAFDCLVATDVGRLRISRAADDDVEQSFVDVADDESVRSWLIEQAVEYIAVVGVVPSKNALQTVSAALSIAFIECDASATDLATTARDAWRRVSAFGHLGDESNSDGCL
jgi:GT2 family glycosyltransferase